MVNKICINSDAAEAIMRAVTADGVRLARRPTSHRGVLLFTKSLRAASVEILMDRKDLSASKILKELTPPEIRGQVAGNNLSFEAEDGGKIDNLNFLIIQNLIFSIILEIGQLADILAKHIIFYGVSVARPVQE
jgi:hypothetical protein